MQQCRDGNGDLRGLRDEVQGCLDAKDEAQGACMVQGVVGGGSSGSGLCAARQWGISMLQIVGAGVGGGNGVSTLCRQWGWCRCNGSSSSSDPSVCGGMTVATLSCNGLK